MATPMETSPMPDELRSSHDSQNVSLKVSCVKDVDNSFYLGTQVPFYAQGSPPFSPTSTPRRAIPNSGRKRALPNLSRGTPDPGHCKKMSAIFQDANSVLRHPVTPRPLLTDTRRLPIPLVKTSNIRTGFVEANGGSCLRRRVSPQGPGTQHQAGCKLRSPTSPPTAEDKSCNGLKAAVKRTGLQPKPAVNEMDGVEPSSSGYASPTAREVKDPQPNSDEVVYPDLTATSAPAALNAALGTATVEGDRRFPLSHIEDWLVNVHDHSPQDPTEALASPPSPTVRRVSSSGIPIASTFERSWSPHSESSCRPPTKFSRPRTVYGHLTEPAKHKVPRLSPTKRGLLADLDQQIVIYEDDTSDQLVELSPSVERYRKGCGPKRERCASYWDTDVLPELANTPGKLVEGQNGRHVLGELPSLTRAKGFVDGIERAQFDFQVYL